VKCIILERKLNRRKAVFLLAKIDEILAWGQAKKRERDAQTEIDPSVHLASGLQGAKYIGRIATGRNGQRDIAALRQGPQLGAKISSKP
jgi:hypothetical protein